MLRPLSKPPARLRAVKQEEGLHALKGDRAGQFSISINDQWRICFRFEPEGVYDVEICDYH